MTDPKDANLSNVTVLGYLTVDIIVRSERWEALPDVSTGDVLICGGGSGANVASWLGTRSNGTTLIGVAGRELILDQFIARLRTQGLAVYLERIGQSPSIISLVQSDGDRKLIVSGSAQFRDGSGVGPAPFNIPSRTDLLYVPAFMLYRTDTRGRTTEALREATVRAIPTIVDVNSAARLASFGVDRLTRLLSTLPLAALLMNEEEGSVLSGALKELAAKAPVIIHRGPAPTVILSGSQTFEVEVDHGALPIQDSTGAGDAFSAGFIIGHLAGMSLDEAIKSAHGAASDVCARLGSAQAP